MSIRLPNFKVGDTYTALDFWFDANGAVTSDESLAISFPASTSARAAISNARTHEQLYSWSTEVVGKRVRLLAVPPRDSNSLQAFAGTHVVDIDITTPDGVTKTYIESGQIVIVRDNARATPARVQNNYIVPAGETVTVAAGTTLSIGGALIADGEIVPVGDIVIG